ncbi:MAG: hypothetical protein ABI644_13230 [Arenimonas sp.]
MKTIFFVTTIAFAIIPSHLFACSPMANTHVNFMASNAEEKIIAPGAPKVSIEHMTRGGDRPDSCSDLGRIILAITAEPAAYAYSFSVIEGIAPTDSFSDKAVIGYDSNGKQTFQFSWLEAGIAPALDFKVRVTAYSKTGGKGGFSIIHIHDDGRK